MTGMPSLIRLRYRRRMTGQEVVVSFSSSRRRSLARSNTIAMLIATQVADAAFVRRTHGNAVYTSTHGLFPAPLPPPSNLSRKLPDEPTAAVLPLTSYQDPPRLLCTWYSVPSTTSLQN